MYQDEKKKILFSRSFKSFILALSTALAAMKKFLSVARYIWYVRPLWVAMALWHFYQLTI